MKTTRQCYYMDRRGVLRCRVVQEPRRKKRARRISPVKLGGLLALLAVIAGAAALFGAGSAPVSQVARVEVAAAPLPALATGVEGVSADDIGMALWTDFAEPAAEAVSLAAEAPAEEAPEAVEEAPVEAEAAEEVAEIPDGAEAQFAEEIPEETAQEEPVAEEPAEADAALEESAAGMPDAAAMFLEDDVPAAAPIAVANASAAAIDVPEDERIDIQTIPEAPAEEEADAEPPEEADAKAPEAE